MVGFRYGNYVVLQGLGNRAYNGKVAIIRTLLGADEDNGRIMVQIVDEGVGVPSSLSRQISVKPENMVRACDCCRHAGAATMQYCGRCKNAAYCNAECQRSDWARHKVYCSTMNSQRQLVKNPLLVAAGRGRLDEVQHLVREGADVNKASKEDGLSAVRLAAEGGHLSVVQYLVQQGADINQATSRGFTPLSVATIKGHTAVANYLREHGAI